MKTFWSTCCFACVHSLLPLALGQPAAPLTYSLPNGLRVVLEQDRRQDRVAVAVGYGVGSRHEPPGYGGLAHLTEHLMSLRSGHVGEGFASHLDRIGASAAGSSTSADATVFWSVVPAGELPTALWLEADRMAFFLKGLSEKAVAMGRQDLLREYAAPSGPSPVSLRAARDGLYPKGHPYRYVGDNPRDIGALKVEHVQWFFQHHHRPDNATIAIVGSFKIASAKTLIGHYFGGIRAHEKTSAQRQAQKGAQKLFERRVKFGHRGEATELSIYYRTPHFLAQGGIELDLLSHLLAGGPSSRLHQALVSGQKVAREVSAEHERRKLESVFRIDIVPSHGERHLDKIVKTIDSALAAIGGGAVTDAELRRAKARRRTRMVRRSQHLEGRAIFFCQHDVPPQMLSLKARMDRDQALSKGSISYAAKKHLAPRPRLLFLRSSWPAAPPLGVFLSEDIRP